MNYLKSLGILRGGLIALGIFDVLIRPEPGSYISYSGWEMVQTLVAPAAAPLFIMVILFDDSKCELGVGLKADFLQLEVLFSLAETVIDNERSSIKCNQLDIQPNYLMTILKHI